jgi:hypothetical protein
MDAEAFITFGKSGLERVDTVVVLVYTLGEVMSAERGSLPQTCEWAGKHAGKE